MRGQVRLGRSGFAVQARLRNIIVIAHAILGGVGGDHAMVGMVEGLEVSRLLPG
jgi:hypothetical protein